MIPKMTTERILFTPKKADSLVKNAAPNRTTQPARVSLFDEIITGGFWQCTHQGIACDIRGKLVDGLHRATSIARCGRSVPILITHNLPDEALSAIDTGKVRSDTDIANLTAGLSGHLSSNQTAVAKAMYGGFTGSPQDRLRGPRLINFIVRHFDPLVFVRVHGGSLPAFLKAPVARAWYSEDRERLAEFLKILSLGVSDSPEDVAAAKLSIEYARAGKSNIPANYRAAWYRKTEACLRAFLAGKKLQAIVEVKSELFDIPEMES